MVTLKDGQKSTETEWVWKQDRQELFSILERDEIEKDFVLSKDFRTLPN